MVRQKLKNETEARAALAAVATSGLSGVEWAHANGVDARSLHCWKLTLRRRGRVETGPELRLVELVVPPPVTEARYRIRVGDIVVEVDDRFEAATLRRVLGVVTGC